MQNVIFPSSEEFVLRDCEFSGVPCVLIYPNHIATKWNEDNKWFRSSIWTKEGNPVSLGFRKFPNLGEQPSFEPIDHLSDLEFVTKLDGSCLIISKFKGELIVRTRGTLSAEVMANGSEIEFLKKKYPLVFDNDYLDSENYSILCEWTTPTNRIVLQESSEPTLWLTGIVKHEDYSYLPQGQLNKIAKLYKVERPSTFAMDLAGISKYLETNETIEGVVIYAGDGQVLKKIKTPRYLYLHRVFTGLKTADQLFDIFVGLGCPYRANFEEMLAKTYDWELVTSIQGLMDQMFRRWDLAHNYHRWVKSQVNTPAFRSLPRKAQAVYISNTFGKWSGFAFGVLDNKKVDPHKLYETPIPE